MLLSLTLGALMGLTLSGTMVMMYPFLKLDVHLMPGAAHAPKRPWPPASSTSSTR